MTYDLRIDGKIVCTCATGEEALERAKAAVKVRPDCEPEILDSTTGRSFERAASQRWRDDLSHKVGY